MPNCPAFTAHARPCTAFGHTHGYCGRHAPMRATPELLQQFNANQMRLRVRWERDQAAPAVAPAPGPVPVGIPVERPMCGHIKRDGRPCEAVSRHPDGKCTMHHNLATRAAESLAGRAALAELRARHARGDTEAQLDAYVAEATHTVSERFARTLEWTLDNLWLSRYITHIRRRVDEGRDAAHLTILIEGWIALEWMTPRRGAILARNAEMQLNARAWRMANPFPQAPALRPDQRVAQLAADTQNVHTAEISKQMRDSLDILCAVEVPATQKETVHEMRDSWREMGKTEAEIHTVYQDVSSWWNKTTIFVTGDKLYRKCMRGLWWTIKNYKGDVRKELEKRLWDECRDACVPYSVCTQGHMARLSNVMVGFDDAFAQPVAVGDILQQKMSAIAAMDVEYEKQIELAEEVLAELKIPHDQHKNWLAAF